MFSALLGNKCKVNKANSEIETEYNLKNLKPNERGIVLNIGNTGAIKRRLMDMGVTPGVSIKVVKVAPFGDPIEIHLRGYELSLRKDEAEQILVEKI